MTYIIRDHDKEKFEAKKQLIRQAVDYINAKYDADIIDLRIEDQYYNMREMVEPHPEIMDIAVRAIQAVGLEPIIEPVRGGTDCSRLSYMGLPTPNVFTGGHYAHGKYEFIPTFALEKAVESLVKIAQFAAEKVRPLQCQQNAPFGGVFLFILKLSLPVDAVHPEDIFGILVNCEGEISGYAGSFQVVRFLVFQLHHFEGVFIVMEAETVFQLTDIEKRHLSIYGHPETTVRGRVVPAAIPVDQHWAPGCAAAAAPPAAGHTRQRTLAGRRMRNYLSTEMRLIYIEPFRPTRPRLILNSSTA